MEGSKRLSFVNAVIIALLVALALALSYLGYRALQPQKPKSLSEIHLATGGIKKC